MSKFRQAHIRAAKLTPDEVRRIRERYADGDSQGTLARDFDMSVGQIGRIVRGESWRQYVNPAAEPPDGVVSPPADLATRLFAELDHKTEPDPIAAFLQGEKSETSASPKAPVAPQVEEADGAHGGVEAETATAVDSGAGSSERSDQDSKAGG